MDFYKENVHYNMRNKMQINLFILGYTKIVKLLLKSGADVNFANDNGRTALHRATEYSKYFFFLISTRKIIFLKKLINFFRS